MQGRTHHIDFCQLGVSVSGGQVGILGLEDSFLLQGDNVLLRSSDCDLGFFKGFQGSSLSGRGRWSVSSWISRFPKHLRSPLPLLPA